MKLEINLLKEIKPKKSILICGLPGIAYIGKLSVDYLIKELKAERIGEIYSRFFPPYVLISKTGIVELLRNELYYYDNHQTPILFFTGNAQATSPEGQYEIADKVLEKALSFGVKRVYSLAAFLTNQSFEVPSVFGSTTNPYLIEEIKRHGVIPMDQGVISGTNGIIFGLARKKKMEGICLLGETRGYKTITGQYILDVKTVRVVLEVLTDILNLKIEMDSLDKQIEQMDELITRIAQVEQKAKAELNETIEKSKNYIT